jgi:hypothetical protein
MLFNFELISVKGGSAFEAQAGVLSRYKFAAFAWGHIIGGRGVETELL